MSLYRWIIAGLWLLFVADWAVAAVGAKRSTGRRRWRREVGLRLVVILLIAALLQSRSLRQFLAETQRSVGHSSLLGWTGAALCLLGFGLAINARRHLGRNWGLPMSRKEQPERIWLIGEQSLYTAARWARRCQQFFGGNWLGYLCIAGDRADSGDARFSHWRKRLLGAAAGPGRRVLHLQCSTRGSRHAAAIP